MGGVIMTSLLFRRRQKSLSIKGKARLWRRCQGLHLRTLKCLPISTHAHYAYRHRAIRNSSFGQSLALTDKSVSESALGPARVTKIYSEWVQGYEGRCSLGNNSSTVQDKRTSSWRSGYWRRRLGSYGRIWTCSVNDKWVLWNPCNWSENLYPGEFTDSGKMRFNTSDSTSKTLAR